MQWSELASHHRHSNQSGFVLVTMVAKKGSSYRQPGARMLVREDLETCGTVSAGCLEEEIARATKPAHQTGIPRMLTIDTRPHYGCPGQITLLLEPLPQAAGETLFCAIEAKLRAREPFVLETDFSDLTKHGPLTRLLPVEANHKKSGASVLRQHVGRRERIVVVGSGDDATAVTKAAVLAGWEVHVVDTAGIQFAPGRLVTQYSPDDRTAVVLMTHNLGFDVSCLHEVLPHAYSYIGVIGSLKRRSELIHGLETTGDFAALGALENLHCPAGLDLGAREPGEIALSVLAEIQCVWSGRDAGSLRLRAEPIHQSE